MIKGSLGKRSVKSFKRHGCPSAKLSPVAAVKGDDANRRPGRLPEAVESQVVAGVRHAFAEQRILLLHLGNLGGQKIHPGLQIGVSVFLTGAVCGQETDKGDG